ncbi:MAG: family 78 glycoside hydrolase catalytic domain [Clostridia bacterium]|nr:family 78 glycoside hydrolase catalytic domain [Clostridia bacterium]
MLLENAKFITTENPRDSVAPVFRKTFAPKKEIRSASLTVTARGIYEAQINGVRVGKFIFAPGWTSYKNRVQVQTYDVTAMLSGENNTIDILLGKGWHYGNIQRGSFDTICDPCVIASLDVEYTDGTAEAVATDESWQYAKTGILYSDYYNGETYDANHVYGDWKPVVITDGKKEALVPQIGEIVTEIEEVPAKTYFITPKGERVIDFGQEITGYVCFRNIADIGDRIVFDHGEVLDRDGNFYNENYRSARSRIAYISDGDKQKWYHPIFSFQGFRYIRLQEYPTNELYLGDFKAIVVHSELKRTGHFTCSDPMINRLYENVIWGQRGNFLDVPTDCPQRDERLGWTGDAQVFCRTAAYNYDVNRFFHKWLGDLALDQAPDGRVAQIIPALWDPDGAFAWGDAATVCPWEIYRAYGDITILEQQYESMKKWCDYVYHKGDGPDAWGGGGQYGDWLGLDAEEGSYRGATNDLLLGTVFLAYECDLVIKAAKALGRHEDVAAYTERRELVAKAFRDTFIGEDGLLTSDTQTAYVVALHFDLAPDRALFAKHLADKVHANGDRIQTGFIGTAYIMDALTDAGYVDLAYSLLLQKEFPSWLYSVRKGATTIWEHWDGLKPDGSVWSRDMNSFNHYAYGAVASWMYGTMCGIRPDEENPGYRNIKIKPLPDARLDYAKAELETRYGTVKSGWEKTADGFLVTVVIPEGATADITIGAKTEHVGAGTYTYTMA